MYYKEIVVVYALTSIVYCIVRVGQVVGLGGAPYACSHTSLIRYEIMWSLSGQSTG